MSDDEMPALNKNGNDSDCEMENDSNGEEEEWEEEAEETEPTECLFCDKTFKSIALAILHLKNEHDFDLNSLKTKYDLDEYSYIKMINYIRTEKASPSKFNAEIAIFWQDEKYLKPVRNESWLMLDLDDLKEQLPNGGNSETSCETITITSAQYKKLQGMINDLTNQLQEKENLLQQATNKIEMMKESFMNFLEQQDVSNNKPAKIDTIKEKLEDCVGSVAIEDDEGYFNTYSHFGIHHDMLSDEVRTSSYRDAILNNGEVFKDKIVLDVGCGTSILSMFASKAGAKEVISIDQSDIIYQAMDIVRRNNIGNIKFVKGRLEDTEMPVEKVDIIISEWMGYFLLFEGMMDSVIYARKNYLKEGGIILPNRCNISLVGYGDVERHNEFIGFWKDVYGFDMSCMKREVLREATVEVCRPEHIITDANIIANYDLMTVDVNCPNFSFDFELKVKRDCQLTSLVGYFDTFFELPQHVEFSTSPFSTPTHWKQVIFYLEEPQDVKENQVIKGKFVCKRDRKDVRSLLISIHYMDKVFKYNLN